MDFRNAPNIITCSRILFSICFLFFPAFSIGFFIFYTLAGLTDLVDGSVARRTKSESELGSKLDTAADWVFIIAALIKIVPSLEIPLWLLIWVIAILILKVVNVAYGFLLHGGFIAIHSTINKIAGLLVFLFPFTVPYFDIIYPSSVLCAVASLATIQEFLLIRNADGIQ